LKIDPGIADFLAFMDDTDSRGRITSLEVLRGAGRGRVLGAGPCRPGPRGLRDRRRRADGSRELEEGRGRPGPGLGGSTDGRMTASGLGRGPGTGTLDVLETPGPDVVIEESPELRVGEIVGWETGSGGAPEE